MTCSRPRDYRCVLLYLDACTKLHRTAAPAETDGCERTQHIVSLCAKCWYAMWQRIQLLCEKWIFFIMLLFSWLRLYSNSTGNAAGDKRERERERQGMGFVRQFTVSFLASKSFTLKERFYNEIRCKYNNETINESHSTLLSH